MARDTVLIVGTGAEEIDVISNSLGKEYKAMQYADGKAALSYMSKNHRNIAMIFIDINMKDIDGMLYLKVLNSNGITKVIPVIVYSDETSDEQIEKCFGFGIVEFFVKPLRYSLIKGCTQIVVNLYKTKSDMNAVVKEQTSRIKEKDEQILNINDRIVEVMSSVVEFRNLESGNHVKRIKGCSRIIADSVRKMYPDFYHLTDYDVKLIESASALHDIGKIAISDSILLKPGRLSPDEFEVIKSHTTLGCEILLEMDELASPDYMRVSYSICRNHHERYDGKGYPDNLAGEDIPVEAQIVSLADTYEALQSDQIYRNAYDKETAYKMIMNGECGSFSEKMLSAFSTVKPMLEKLCNEFEDE